MILHCKIPESEKTRQNIINLGGPSWLYKIQEDRARENEMLQVCRSCSRSCKNYYVPGLTKFECYIRSENGSQNPGGMRTAELEAGKVSIMARGFN